MNPKTGKPEEDHPGGPADAALGPVARHPDKAIANCSRLLLDSAPAAHVIPKALAGLVRDLGAAHAVLFQIKSYHAEDYRGQWLACSSPEDCPFCREVRDWDHMRLIDADMRSLFEAGHSRFLSVDQLLPDFSQVLAGLGVTNLAMMPLKVTGKWWGCLCIENMQTGTPWESACHVDLGILATLFSIYYERRHAVEGCQEREQLSGALEMAGTVCHKLNQPMQIILGYASMVTSGDIQEAEQVKEIVQLIEDETRRMGIMTKNLMGITKNRSAA